MIPEGATKPTTINRSVDMIASRQRPLIPIRSFQPSTFTPTLFNYYQVVHYMDNLIAYNRCFREQGVIWHPFVSRLYFAVLGYYQTLRAMDYAKIGNLATHQLTSYLLAYLPPETLPVPGPLLPILEAICCTSPENTRDYRLVCPRIPDLPGPCDRPSIQSPYPSMLAMPNIPLLLGLANSILYPIDDKIPDYTKRTTFDNTVDHIFSGYTFPANNWNDEQRNLLCQPGMHAFPETSPDLDKEFNLRGKDLQLPVVETTTRLQSIAEFTQMDDLSWIQNIIPTMTSYCSFFEESGYLGDCSPKGPPMCLVRSRPTALTSPNAETNIGSTLTKAFPNRYAYQLIYDQRSYEVSIPNSHNSAASYACINTRCDHTGMGAWANINLNDAGRAGPYWRQHPSKLRADNVQGFKEVKQLIGIDYYIENPLNEATSMRQHDKSSG